MREFTLKGYNPDGLGQNGLSGPYLDRPLIGFVAVWSLGWNSPQDLRVSCFQWKQFLRKKKQEQNR